MYAAGHGTRSWRATRAGGRPHGARRLLAAAAAVVLAALTLAVAAHGSPPRAAATVVVQPGDTLWSIAAEHYPADDVRARVQDIEDLNGLAGPAIRPGQTLELPG
jgi:LysM repeat protein